MFAMLLEVINLLKGFFRHKLTLVKYRTVVSHDIIFDHPGELH